LFGEIELERTGWHFPPFKFFYVATNLLEPTQQRRIENEHLIVITRVAQQAEPKVELIGSTNFRTRKYQINPSAGSQVLLGFTTGRKGLIFKPI